MPYAPGQTTGYNSVPDYLDANRGTLDREAGDVNGLIGTELDSAKSAADSVASSAYGSGAGADFSAAPGYLHADELQNRAQQDATNTKTQGGLQDLLGRTGHGHASAFDAELLGSRDFGATQKRADSLHDYLNTATQASAADGGGGQIDHGRTPGSFGGQDQPAQTPYQSPTNGGGNTGQPGTGPMGPTQSVPNRGPGDVYPPAKRGNPLMGYL